MGTSKKNLRRRRLSAETPCWWIYTPLCRMAPVSGRTTLLVVAAPAASAARGAPPSAVEIAGVDLILVRKFIFFLQKYFQERYEYSFR